jgi:hypothetical protein
MASGMPYPGPDAENLTCIPRDLTARPQWVLWRAIEQQTDMGTAITKRPIDAETRRGASSTDPETWHAYPYCVAALPLALEEWAYETTLPYHGGGLGYVLTDDDPYTGIDLDACVDPLTGEVSPEAQAIVHDMDSYTEITPSATGLRIFVRGKLPPTHRKKGHIEMYDTVRFLTVTGWHHEGTPADILPRQGALDRLWCALWGAQVGDAVLVRDSAGEVINQGTPWTIAAIMSDAEGRPRAHFTDHAEPWLLVQCTVSPPLPTNGVVTPFSDTEVMQRAVSAANGVKVERLAKLGDYSEYGSHSEADLALCILIAFWSRDAEQIDRLFRLSALMRPKWDERRGALTYGQRTIKEALARQDEYYTQLGVLSIATWATPSASGEPTAWPDAVLPQLVFTDLADMLERVYPLPEWLIDDLIPEGLVFFVGSPKSSKTYLAYSLALSLAIEAERSGLWLGQYDINKAGPVVYLSLEDDEADSRKRIAELAPSLQTMSRDRFIFVHGMEIPRFDQGLIPILKQQVIDRYHPALIVLDPISYLYAQTRKNADQFGEVKDMLLPLRWLGKEHHCTILGVDHRRKRSSEDVDIFETTYGSTAKIAVADSILMVVRDQSDVTLHARVRKAEDQTITLGFTFAPDGTALWEWKGATKGLHDQSRQSDLRRRVIMLLAHTGYPISIEEIMLELDIPPSRQARNSIDQILLRARKAGEIVKTERGMYAYAGEKKKVSETQDVSET